MAQFPGEVFQPMLMAFAPSVGPRKMQLRSSHLPGARVVVLTVVVLVVVPGVLVPVVVPVPCAPAEAAMSAASAAGRLDPLCMDSPPGGAVCHRERPGAPALHLPSGQSSGPSA